MSDKNEEKETKPAKEDAVLEVVSEEEPVQEEKETISKSQGGKNSARTVAPTVLTEEITVYVSKLVHKNIFERNSRSVGVTQIRLMELGYASAGGDKRGYLGDDTLSAIQEFQRDNKLADLSFSDEKVVRAIFAGTPVVVSA